LFFSTPFLLTLFSTLFPYTTLFRSICSVGIFFGFEIFNPAIDLKEAIGTSVFFAMGIFASTIARKTQSILGQKAFLLSLRNQYRDRKSTRLNFSHLGISYAVFCLKK